MKQRLRSLIRNRGERLPKKHGDWYRINVFDNHWLVLDTWNGAIDWYKGECKDSGTDNMYGVIYGFSDRVTYVTDSMVNFWYQHIRLTPYCDLSLYESFKKAVDSIVAALDITDSELRDIYSEIDLQRLREAGINGAKAGEYLRKTLQLLKAK